MPVLDVVLVAVLIMLNAAFAGSEMALVSLREGQIRGLAERGGAGAVVARLTKDPNRFLSTIQVGITLAGFLASATAAISLAEPIGERLPLPGNIARPTAVVLVTLVLTFVTLVVGELAPKRLAMQRPEGWSLVAARPLAITARVAAPAVAVLGWATDLVIRVFGADPEQTREPVTEEELKDMIISQETLSADERRIVAGALDITERTLGQILVPRSDVYVLDAEEPTRAALQELLAAGYSRAPVARGGDLDDLVGVVHLRDLIGTPGSATEVAHAPVVFAETLPALDALRLMQQRRDHLAVVLDEHQVVSGIVTMEDLLEEIVGEIYDEVDRDVAAVRRDDDGGLVVPGSFPTHDLEDLGVEVPPGPYTTVAGLVIEELGEIPEEVGVSIVVSGWRLEVVGLRRRRISRVRITPEEQKEHTAPGET